MFTEGIVTGSAPGKDPSGILDFGPGISGRGSFSAGPPRSGIANALRLEKVRKLAFRPSDGPGDVV